MQCLFYSCGGTSVSEFVTRTCPARIIAKQTGWGASVSELLGESVLLPLAVGHFELRAKGEESRWWPNLAMRHLGGLRLLAKRRGPSCGATRFAGRATARTLLRHAVVEILRPEVTLMMPTAPSA